MVQYFRFLIIASVVGTASAGFTTGNQLKIYMDDDEKGASFNGGVYSGYVVGIHDAFDGKLFCTPQDVTKGQIKAIVAKYLKASPEVWNRPAEEIVISALRIVFPCKTN